MKRLTSTQHHPAFFKLIEVLLIILLQIKTILGKAKKKIVEENKAKLGRQKLSEKDVEVKLLVDKIEYSEKQHSRLLGKASQKLIK